MKYIIFRLKGNQYKAQEGDEVLIDKLGSDKTKAEVLLLVDNGKVKVGKPILKNVEVKFKVLSEEEKGKKLTVLKYKAKSRYRKKIGFRPVYTRLLVQKIN
jgi:large subunit ribosomal protein L21